MIMEITFKLNNKGDVVEESARIATLDNMKFAFKIFAHAPKPEHVLERGTGWNAFQASSCSGMQA